jgi:hypothetical protein
VLRGPADVEHRSDTDAEVRVPADYALQLGPVSCRQRSLKAALAGERGRGALGAVELFAVCSEGGAQAGLQHGVRTTRFAALRQGVKSLKSGSERQKRDQREVARKPEFETPHVPRTS